MVAPRDRGRGHHARGRGVVVHLLADRLMRVSGAAQDQPTPTRLDNRYLIAFAPPVAKEFWGSVTYTYKDGQIQIIEVKETVKP